MRTLFLFLLLGFFAWGCSDSDDDPDFDPVKQAATDDQVLRDWFAGRGLSNQVTRTSSGLFYQITKPTPDSLLSRPDYAVITNGKRVFVRYEGRLLNDTLFDSNLNSASAFVFVPGNRTVIAGWEEGVKFFRKGEEGYLYIPSGLAYGNSTRAGIPRNSCLRFFIRISNVE
jgi:FKBP-type peptidyl-prolyl cis-trans isomerase FkpA